MKISDVFKIVIYHTQLLYLTQIFDKVTRSVQINIKTHRAQNESNRKKTPEAVRPVVKLERSENTTTVFS